MRRKTFIYTEDRQSYNRIYYGIYVCIDTYDSIVKGTMNIVPVNFKLCHMYIYIYT